MVVALILFFHNGTVPNWGLLLVTNAAVVVVVHMLIVWHGRGTPGKTVDFLRHFYPVLLYTFFFCETGLLNRMFFTDYLDPAVIRWEQAVFGFQPSVLFMHKLPYLAVSELFYASYFSYYVMIAGVGIALFIRNREQFFHYVSVISFVFYICYTIYIFVPVIGPRVFFREIAGYNLPVELQQLAVVENYPAAVQSGPFYQLMAWIYRTFESPGAAMPSSHVAIALCTTFFSFLYLKRIRYLHLVMALLLCLSTIYCRYHYALDVLAGIVTAAVLLPVGNLLYRAFDRSRSKIRYRL
jgi:membrane-associated phospholipid phosphatase